MKSFFEAFKKFITRGNVVDMAIGVAVGTAFTAIVTAFTKGIISPLLALLSTSGDLAAMKWVIREAEVEIVDGVETIINAEVAIMYGTLLQAIIDFLMISFVLFCILRFATAFMNRANKMAKKMQEALRPKDKEEAEEAARAAEEAAKAAEEAARVAAEEEARAKAAEEERMRLEVEEKAQAQAESLALLRQIRDLLQQSK
ncbi:MAG: MscL family protein [Clostridia bacterium]|nr:MscL family protein [Clostridia bacterium]